MSDRTRIFEAHNSDGRPVLTVTAGPLGLTIHGGGVTLRDKQAILNLQRVIITALDDAHEREHGRG